MLPEFLFLSVPVSPPPPPFFSPGQLGPEQLQVMLNIKVIECLTVYIKRAIDHKDSFIFSH